MRVSVPELDFHREQMPDTYLSNTVAECPSRLPRLSQQSHCPAQVLSEADALEGALLAA
jgi:hypothetical protein